MSVAVSPVALLRASRLGQQWPDPRPFAAHLEAMEPAVHRGLGPEVTPEPTSGLPGYVHWQRVVADRSLAADGLVQLGDEASLRARAQTRGLPVDHKQLARFEYYRALSTCPPLALDHVEVRLRRIEGERAHVSVVLDKLEADGRCLRLAVQAAQVGARGLVRIRDDLAGATGALRDLIFRQAALDVEALWVALADQPDLVVERIEKGTLGPLFWPHLNWPAAWRDLPAVGPVLSCPLAVAGLDLAADHDGDPLAPAPPALAAARARYGFRISRERRFFAPTPLEGPLRQWCRDQGRACIVRGVG